MDKECDTQWILSPMTLSPLNEAGVISIRTYALYTGHLERIFGAEAYSIFPVSELTEHRIDEGYFWFQILTEILEKTGDSREVLAQKIGVQTDFINRIMHCLPDLLIPYSVGSALLAEHERIRPDLQSLPKGEEG